MSVITASEVPKQTVWNPESDSWAAEGKRLSWQTLWVTTFCLILSFATWFMVSAIVVKLQKVGFNLQKSELFWLTATPGLAAGTLRIVHTFLIPVFGTRKTITVSTLLLVIPCIGWFFAIQNPATPYSVLILLAFLAGLGGGNFSSFMPSTSLFFPKRMLGTALGIQAGIGNFGVSVAQFVIPWIVGLSLFGTAAATSHPSVSAHPDKPIWLQNAAVVWLPFILVGAILAWVLLRDVPVKATFREQTDIFKNKHTWFMTSIYFMTFGSFAGLSAAFPLLIKELYGKFPGAPDPLKYAFLGPLIGALVRVLFGPISDKFGGAKVTLVSGIGLLTCAIGVSFYTNPQSIADFHGFLYFMLGIFFFTGVGNSSTFKQMPMIFPPRQASGVIGWTSAIGAYGQFLFPVIISAIMVALKAPTAFFYGVAVFYAINTMINWWFYARKGAEKPC